MADAHSIKGHTGRTVSGHTRDVKIQRIGRVTVYKRGKAYYLYYRDRGRSVRRRVDGNIATARVMASKVAAAVEEGSPSPFGFTRVAVDELLNGFIEYCESVRGLALRTVDRYRATLGLFRRFAAERLSSSAADEVTQAVVEDFVKWLRRQRRTRNGAETGKQGPYSTSSIRFALSTCRTAFNWAKKRRYLPPYAENPFSAFGVDKIREREQPEVQVLTPSQQVAFFDACDSWQRPIFLMLAAYGLRVGELAHLLVSDVHMEEAVFEIRSKPEMHWAVKTQRERSLPIAPELRQLFEHCINGRKEGFLFLNREFVEGNKEPCQSFTSRQAFILRLQELAEEAREQGAQNERDLVRAITPFLRDMGLIPEKRIRQEFMKITQKIGCPELTRAHSLRHLFSTRVQEQGMNPLLVQSILGHSTLDMTWRYTHFGMDAKRQAVSQILQADPVLRESLGKIGS